VRTQLQPYHPAENYSQYTKPKATPYAPGKKILLVTGILYIVLGSTKIITILVMLVIYFYSTVTSLELYVYFYFFYGFVMGIINIAIGCTGICYRLRLNKAGACKALIIILFFLTFIEVFSTIAISPLSFILGFLGLVLSFLFLVGANKNLEAFRQNSNLFTAALSQ